MKKFAAVILSLVLIFSSCGRAEYRPMIVLPEGFSAHGNVISGKLFNVYYFEPYESIFPVDGGKMTLYEDATLSNYLEEGAIELFDGENDFVLVFEKDGLSTLYELHISCVMILDFSIEVLEEKTYAVGEFFDTGTIRVTAKKDSGGYVVITDYSLEYGFDAPGEHRVDVLCGGIVHSLYVNVK